MPIDQCPHSFSHMARIILPEYMAAMRQSMCNPVAMSLFATPGVGVRSLLRQFAKDTDFSGCYALLEGEKPIYVGISRNVFSRLRQHVTGKMLIGIGI